MLSHKLLVGDVVEVVSNLGKFKIGVVCAVCATTDHPYFAYSVCDIDSIPAASNILDPKIPEAHSESDLNLLYRFGEFSKLRLGSYVFIVPGIFCITKYDRKEDHFSVTNSYDIRHLKLRVWDLKVQLTELARIRFGFYSFKTGSVCPRLGTIIVEAKLQQLGFRGWYQCRADHLVLAVTSRLIAGVH